MNDGPYSGIKNGRVVDAETSAGLGCVGVLFYLGPNSGSAVTDQDGYFSIPEKIGDLQAGDYFQAAVIPQTTDLDTGYAPAWEHIKVSEGILTGAEPKVLYLTKKSSQDQLNLAEKVVDYFVEIPLKLENLLFSGKSANAASDDTTKYSVYVYDAAQVVRQDGNSSVGVVNALHREGVEGAHVYLMRKAADGEMENISEGTTDESGLVTFDLSPDKYSGEVFIACEKKGLAKNVFIYNLGELNVREKNSVLGERGRVAFATEIFMWPDYATENGYTQEAESMHPLCSKKYQFYISYFSSESNSSISSLEVDIAKKHTASLATVICALEESNPHPANLPVPRIYYTHAGSNGGAYAYTRLGSNFIVANTDFFSQQISDKLKPFHYFRTIVHEYGHIVDFAQDLENLDADSPTSKAYYEISDEFKMYPGQLGWGGAYSGTATWTRLYAIMQNNNNNYIWQKIKRGEKWDTNNYYFRKDNTEFWAESFSTYMAKSFVPYLGKIGLSGYTGEDLAELIMPRSDKTSNATIEAFTKKYMATALGAYCHRMLNDDNNFNRSKISGSIAKNEDEWFVRGYLNTSPLITGGPLDWGKVVTGYSTEEINDSDHWFGGHKLTVKYKQLPSDYERRGYAPWGELRVLVYSQGTEPIPADKIAEWRPNNTKVNYWTDIYKTDQNRCGYYLYPKETDVLFQTEPGKFSSEYFKEAKPYKENSDLYEGDVEKSIRLGQMSKYIVYGLYQCKDEEVQVIPLTGVNELNDSSPTKQVVEIDFSKLPKCSKPYTTDNEASAEVGRKRNLGYPKNIAN